MARYYFTISSLPELKLFDPPPITIASFFQHCTTEVRNKHFRILEELAEDRQPAKPHPALTAWREYMDDLAHELSYMRAERLDRPHERTRHGGRDIREAARHLLGLTSPLDAEKEYMSISWELAEALEAGHLFDETTLLLYLIKLKILLRYELFQQRLGKEEFTSVFSHIQHRIEQI